MASIGRKFGKSIQKEFDYRKCADCDFTFVRPFSGFDIYDEAYYAGRGIDPSVNYAAEYLDYRSTDRTLELQDLARLAAEHFERNPPREDEISWLDFGCGAGSLLKYLRDAGKLEAGARRLGLRVTGSDVGTYATKLRERDQFQIADFEQLKSAPENSYHVITMIEVIEHLPDPFPIVRELARLLKPGGILLLTTGNLASPAARRKGIHGAYCVPEIHVSLFTPHTLDVLYAKCGLRQRLVQYDGVVRFKVLKRLQLLHPLARTLGRLALRLPGTVRWIDHRNGVSAMPCAVKA